MTVLWPPSLLFRRKYRGRDPFDMLDELAAGEAPFRTLIHVGAHLAQERQKYEALGYRDILWIEGSPSVHQRLAEIIAAEAGNSPCRHRTLCALLTDRDGGDAELRQCSNDGMSSSIFPLSEGSSEKWRGVHETGIRERVHTRTLDAVAGEFGFFGTIDTLVIDVQGAELLVLQGADRVLQRTRAIVSEVSTRRYYDGGVLFPELRAFLKRRRFFPMAPPRRHCDLLFLREGRASAL